MSTLAFYGQFTASGVGATGLTVTCTVKRITRSDGTVSTPATAQAATELASGVYFYRLTGADLTLYDYVAIFSTAGTADLKDVPAAFTNFNAAIVADGTGTVSRVTLVDTTTANADMLTAAAAGAAVLDAAASAHDTAGTIGAKINAAGSAADPLENEVPGDYAAGTAGYRLGQVGSGSVTYTGPVNPTTGAMSLTRGDDYLAADGRELSYAVAVGGGNPDLTGAAVVASWYESTPAVAGRATATAATTTVTATVTDPGTAGQTVSLDLPAATSALLAAPKYVVKVLATLADGSAVTVLRAACTVTDP